MHKRSNASEACWQVEGDVIGYQFDHFAALGRFHQLTVDAYGAQHAGESAAAIGVAFALIGLRLSLDEGWDGDQVREAHRYLATTPKGWPTFTRSPGLPSVTALDVAMADSPEAHARAVERWAADAWAIWTPAQEEVIALIDARLPPEVRRRLRRR